jgi:hypothetical protein
MSPMDNDAATLAGADFGTAGKLTPDAALATLATRHGAVFVSSARTNCVAMGSIENTGSSLLKPRRCAGGFPVHAN